MIKLKGRYSGVLIHQLERLFNHGSAAGSTEGELLERFAMKRDESAFEALVARHGPMVLGVCRQLLHDPNDVDDAFQATFLVLVRKAGTLRRRDLLGNWLYGVAHRVALRARSMAARRTGGVASGGGGTEALERALARDGADSSVAHAVELEQGPLLHQEIAHLPERYRVPIVLCYLEGLTHDEAASRLGWPVGTVKGRLARARNLLRRRLGRRGVTLSLAALTTELSMTEANAAVPASLEYATLKAAQAIVNCAGASLGATTALSLPVAALVEGVLNTMIATQVKSIAFSLVLVGTVATGLVVGASQLSGPAGNKDATSSSSFLGGGPVDGALNPDPGQQDRPNPKSLRPADGKGESQASESYQRLAGERDTFSRLLSELRQVPSDLLDRLTEWSALVLESDLVLSSDQADRVAAARAHRDRMLKLADRIQRIAAPKNAKDAQAARQLVQPQLDEAERWLESESEGRPVGPVFSRNAQAGAGAMAGGMGQMMGMMMKGGMGAGMMKGARPSGMMAMMGGAGPARGKRQAVRKAVRAAGPAESGAAAVGEPATGPGAAGPGGAGMIADRSDQSSGSPAGPAGMVGMMGQVMAPEVRNRRIRLNIARDAARLAVSETNPRSQAVLKKLQEAVSMSFANETPLDDVLKYIKQATSTRTSPGLQFYVDPKGLEEANCTMQATISLDLDAIPLKTTLRLLLKQIGLAYCVRDGVVIISSVQGIARELQEADNEQEGEQAAKEEDHGGLGVPADAKNPQ